MNEDRHSKNQPKNRQALPEVDYRPTDRPIQPQLKTKTPNASRLLNHGQQKKPHLKREEDDAERKDVWQGPAEVERQVELQSPRRRRPRRRRIPEPQGRRRIEAAEGHPAH